MHLALPNKPQVLAITKLSWRYSFGDIDVLEDLRSDGTPGISQKRAHQTNPVAPLSLMGSSSSGENSRAKPLSVWQMLQL